MKRLCFAILLLSTSILFSVAQNPFIKNYTVSDGLPSNKIYHVYRDSKNFMWLATDGGVVRFDGSDFTSYNTRHGLSGNIVMRIKEDSFGRIWFLNMNGSINYFYKGDIFNTQNAPFLKELKTDFYLMDFYEDKDSTLYFYNSVSEVFAIKNNELVNYKDFKFNENEDVALHYFNKSPDGEIHLWTAKGIYKLTGMDGEKNLIQQPFSVLKVFKKTENESFALDNERNVHLFHNLSLYRGNIFQVESILVNSVLTDNEGLIWIATFDKGVYCYKDNKIVLHLDIILAQALSEDNENNIWISAEGSGMYKINRDILKYEFLGKDKFDNTGIIKIAHSYQGELWATNGKSLFLIKNNKKFPRKISLGGEIINNIFELKNRTIIYNGNGTHLHLIKDVHVDYKNNTIEIGNPEIFKYRVKKIALDTTKNKLYANINDRLIIADLRDPTFPSFYNSTRGRINNLFFNPKNELVVNANTNFVFDRDSVFHNTIYNELDEQKINSHLIIEKNNELFNLIGNKLMLLSNGNFYNLSEEFQSQIDYRIKGITYYDSTLFFFTIKTLYFITNPLKIINNETVELNRLNTEFNNINDIYCQDSIVHIASDDGLLFIPVKECVNAKSQPTKPYFSNVTLDEKSYDFLSGKVEYKKQKRLSIGFSSLNYSSIPSIFTYKLEGADENWITGNEKRVVYLNLSPGNYDFLLKSRKNMEGYSETISLPIIVHPTFFQRLTVQIFLLLFILTVLFLIIRFFYKRKINQKEVETVLITLENKALQSMMNPHFIFNSLGSIQSYLLQNKAKKAGTYLSQFARLIRQNMNSLKSNVISIEEEVERLINYLELEKLRLNDTFEFNIEVDDEIDEYDTNIPSMIVQPFVENAIWHGISSLDKRGRITIKFTQYDFKSVLITVEDNGIGMEKSKSFSKSDQNLNVGISLTNKRLKLIANRYKINSIFTTNELDPQSDNPGTRVTFTVPVIN